MGGLMIDTSVFIEFERKGLSIDFARWEDFGDTCISAITYSELLVGVHRADTRARRIKRQAFIDAVLNRMRLLPVDEPVAVEHARLSASLTVAGRRIGAHDLLIAATALCHQCAILTANAREFGHVPALQVLPY